MKKLLCCACSAVLSIAAAVPSFAAGSPWDGTWKMNTQKSKLTGDTFTITMKPDGMMHYATGSTVSYDFKCDGKPYPVLADRTVTCSGSPGAGYDFHTMASGKVLSESHQAISSDGKMMMIQGKSMHVDGTSSTYDETYKRVAGTSGMAGKWLNVKDSENGMGAMVMVVDGDRFKLEFPDNKTVIQGKLDGSDSPVTGPTIPAGAFESCKAESPMKLHFVDKYKEKVLDEGTYTLSDGGKVLTEEEWEPGKMSEKATMVYDRQ
jgi:hypothetical protein